MGFGAMFVWPILLGEAARVPWIGVLLYVLGMFGIASMLAIGFTRLYFEPSRRRLVLAGLVSGLLAAFGVLGYVLFMAKDSTQILQLFILCCCLGPSILVAVHFLAKRGELIAS